MKHRLAFFFLQRIIYNNVVIKRGESNKSEYRRCLITTHKSLGLQPHVVFYCGKLLSNKQTVTGLLLTTPPWTSGHYTYSILCMLSLTPCAQLSG
jgi:hypothetical protein